MANYTQITATNISDAAGNKLANGTIAFQATDASNQPIPFQVGGGGQVVTTPATATITNGQIVGTFQVANPLNTAPSGILYRVTITDNALNKVVAAYALVSFSGDTFNFDNYLQSNSAVIPPAGGVVNGALVVNGNLSVTGTLLSGQPGAGATARLGTFSIPATTWTLVHSMGTQAVQAKFYDNSWNEILPDSAVSTDVNTFTATFLQAQVGYMVVVNVGNWTPSISNPNNIIANPTSSQSIAGDFPFTLAGSLSTKRLEGIRFADQFSGIQAAVTDAGASGEVYIPAGTYQPTAQIVLGSPIRIVGAGQGATIIKPTAALAAALFSLTGTGYGYELCNLTVDMSNVPAQDVISLNVAAAHPVFRNLHIVYPAAATGKAFNFGSANGGLLHILDTTIVNPGYGIYIQGDTAQENFFSNVSIDTPTTIGIDIERTTAGDTGAAYFVNCRVTNSGNSATGISWKVNSSAPNTEQPVFLLNCVGDASLAGGHTAQFINVADIRISGGWFTNGAAIGANLSALYLSGVTDFSLNHARVSSLSRDLTLAGTETRVQFSNATFAGTATNIYASGATLSSVRFIGSTFQGTVASAADTQILAGGASTVAPVLSTTGGQIWTLSSGSAPTLDIFDATSGAATPHKYIRTSSGELQVVNSGFAAAIMRLSDAGQLTVAAGAVVGAAAPVVGGGQVGLGSTTATTATAGANGAVPAQVAGYLIINIAGTNFKLPYFAV